MIMIKPDYLINAFILIEFYRANLEAYHGCFAVGQALAEGRCNKGTIKRKEKSKREWKWGRKEK